MKTLKMLLPIALIVLSFSASAQTADEIVSKYVTAMGGKDKLSSLKSAKMEGIMNVQGNDINIVMTKVHNTGLRMELDVMGSSNYQAMNTKGGVTFFPVRGMQAPAPMEEEQFKAALPQLDLQGALFNYKDKGTKLEYAGTEKVGTNDAYKLTATLSNGSVVNYFVDTKTNMVVKTTSKRKVEGQEMDLETTYSDFKQNADGYWFPYTIVAVQGTTSFDKITTNVTVDSKIFEQ
ncbi:MAG: hypothetical protein ABIY51_10125 [Ferruginibacter sp.]